MAINDYFRELQAKSRQIIENTGQSLKEIGQEERYSTYNSVLQGFGKITNDYVARQVNDFNSQKDAIESLRLGETETAKRIVDMGDRFKISSILSDNIKYQLESAKNVVGNARERSEIRTEQIKQNTMLNMTSDLFRNARDLEVFKKYYNNIAESVKNTSKYPITEEFQSQMKALYDLAPEIIQMRKELESDIKPLDVVKENLRINGGNFLLRTHERGYFTNEQLDSFLDTYTKMIEGIPGGMEVVAAWLKDVLESYGNTDNVMHSFKTYPYLFNGKEIQNLLTQAREKTNVGQYVKPPFEQEADEQIRSENIKGRGDVFNESTSPELNLQNDTLLKVPLNNKTPAQMSQYAAEIPLVPVIQENKVQAYNKDFIAAAQADGIPVEDNGLEMRTIPYGPDLMLDLDNFRSQFMTRLATRWMIEQKYNGNFNIGVITKANERNRIPQVIDSVNHAERFRAAYAIAEDYMSFNKKKDPTQRMQVDLGELIADKFALNMAINELQGWKGSQKAYNALALSMLRNTALEGVVYNGVFDTLAKIQGKIDSAYQYQNSIERMAWYAVTKKLYEDGSYKFVEKHANINEFVAIAKDTDVLINESFDFHDGRGGILGNQPIIFLKGTKNNTIKYIEKFKGLKLENTHIKNDSLKKAIATKRFRLIPDEYSPLILNFEYAETVQDAALGKYKRIIDKKTGQRLSAYTNMD